MWKRGKGRNPLRPFNKAWNAQLENLEQADVVELLDTLDAVEIEVEKGTPVLGVMVHHRESGAIYRPTEAEPGCEPFCPQGFPGPELPRKKNQRSSESRRQTASMRERLFGGTDSDGAGFLAHWPGSFAKLTSEAQSRSSVAKLSREAQSRGRYHG